MSRMDEAMQELVDAIKFSEEYIRYQDIKNRVHNQPQLEQQIHAFRHKNYLLQNSDGNVDLYDATDLKIVVDATKDLLVNVLQYHPFLIKPNNHELGEIFGVKITEKEDVITYAKKMQEKGAGNVLVSMAGDGAVLVAEDGSIFQAEAPKGKVVNSVGAGDSMVAGFVTGYLKTGSYKEAFQMGVCTGSASAFSEELATEPEVLALLDKNKGIFK